MKPKYTGNLCECVDCEYWRFLTAYDKHGIKCCHYLLGTGNVRGLPPIYCYKRKGTPYKRKENSYGNAP